MPYQITPADRTSFQRCRRQWDFGARARRNLEPLEQPAPPDLDLAIREALDIYYFPGMWDWQRHITLPLVLQAFQRAVTRQRERCGDEPDDEIWQQLLAAGNGLLGRYFAWAPTVDRFSPVLVEGEYDVTILEPARPTLGLVTAGGEPIRFRGRIDLLAVDSNDAYWIVRHRLVEGDWPATQTLIDDEATVAACWAWEQFYLGMAIAGTIYNEVRTDLSTEVPASIPAQSHPGPRPGSERRGPALRRWLPKSRHDHPQPVVRQHEPSGGGRSIPQHRRMYAVAREPNRFERIEQHVEQEFRRTWVRRSPAEVTEAGGRLAAEAAEMAGPGVSTDPSPSPAICPACAYLAPCQAMSAGRSEEPLLRSGYRERPEEKLVEGRLGGGAWSTGRGAAPPKFRDGP
jgi:hypothetical protein